jgi:hypothetical protein
VALSNHEDESSSSLSVELEDVDGVLEMADWKRTDFAFNGGGCNVFVFICGGVFRVGSCNTG